VGGGKSSFALCEAFSELSARLRFRLKASDARSLIPMETLSGAWRIAVNLEVKKGHGASSEVSSANCSLGMCG